MSGHLTNAGSINRRGRHWEESFKAGSVVILKLYKMRLFSFDVSVSEHLSFSWSQYSNSAYTCSNQSPD